MCRSIAVFVIVAAGCSRPLPAPVATPASPVVQTVAQPAPVVAAQPAVETPPPKPKMEKWQLYTLEYLNLMAGIYDEYNDDGVVSGRFAKAIEMEQSLRKFVKLPEGDVLMAANVQNLQQMVDIDYKFFSAIGKDIHDYEKSGDQKHADELREIMVRQLDKHEGRVPKQIDKVKQLIRDY